MVIVNPSSGSEESENYRNKVLDKLQNKGYRVTSRITQKVRDAVHFAQEACESNLDLIVIMGGDGTINEVINGIAPTNHYPTLLIIPFGTVNNFAKALELPLNPDEAIEIIEKGQFQNVDIGKVNDQYFMNLINLGVIAEATYSVTAEQKSKYGSFAYFIEGVKKFSEKDVFRVQIETDIDTLDTDAMFVLVAVTDTFAGWKNMIKEAEIDDGYLHLFIFKELTSIKSIAMIAKLMSGSLKEQKNVIYRKAKEAIIQTNTTKVINVDGDEGEETPLKIRILPSRLRVMV